MKTIKKSFFLSLFLFLSLSYFNISFAQIPEKEGFVLYWSDEFDGNDHGGNPGNNLDEETGLNLNNWSFETGRGSWGWGTGQKDYATRSKNNVEVKDGKLLITLRDGGAPDNGDPYTSGRINTSKKVDFKYGYIEARIKGPLTPGLGFAFWMLGSDSKESGSKNVGWPKCGEIDIAELAGGDPNGDDIFGNYNIFTLHFRESYGHGQKRVASALGNFSEEYHTFAMEWDPITIRMFLDGNRVGEVAMIRNPINNYHPFNRPFYIILSAGVGNEGTTYGGGITGETVFPCTIDIDYVRIYQKEGGYDESHLIPTNINNVENLEQNTFIYPNPVDDILNINTPDPNNIKRIELYSINGHKIKNFGAENLSLNLSDIPSGIFQLKIILNDDFYSIHRIIKK